MTNEIDVIEEQEDKTISITLKDFNDNIEYINKESRDVIENLKSFLKKMLSRILKSDEQKFDAKQLQAINSLYITLGKSISEFNENNMILVSKMLELNEIINPKVEKDIGSGSGDEELDEIKNFFANMNKSTSDQDKYLED